MWTHVTLQPICRGQTFCQMQPVITCLGCLSEHNSVVGSHLYNMLALKYWQYNMLLKDVSGGWWKYQMRREVDDWVVRCDLAVFFCGVFVVYLSIVVNVCWYSDWVGESIDTFIALAAVACLSCEMISTVSHKLPDLACKSWIVLWELCFDVMFDAGAVLDGPIVS